MKLCTCCSAERRPDLDRYVGTLVYPETFGPMFNCRECDSTYLLVMWELPEEEQLLDGELYQATNSLSDLRPVEAA